MHWPSFFSGVGAGLLAALLLSWIAFTIFVRFVGGVDEDPRQLD